MFYPGDTIPVVYPIDKPEKEQIYTFRYFYSFAVYAILFGILFQLVVVLPNFWFEASEFKRFVTARNTKTNLDEIPHHTLRAIIAGYAIHHEEKTYGLYP